MLPSKLYARTSLVLSVLLLSSAAQAQDYGNVAEQYSRLVSKASDVVALDERLFGDAVGLYTGSLSFAQTDVSLPGSGFPMSVGRSFAVQGRGGNPYWATGAFGDWDLDLPHIEGVFAATSASTSGWKAGNSSQRCAAATVGAAAPPVVPADVGYSVFVGTEYWDGNQFSLGGGNQEMMLVSSSNPNKPTDGLDYRWVTNNQWFFSCLTSTANGFAGDAFLARGPDGTKIWFDHLAKRPFPTLKRWGFGGAALMGGDPESRQLGRTRGAGTASNALSPANETNILAREQNRLLPTRIEDRFGNAITFTYHATIHGRLLSMQASDGRTLSFTYNGDGLIATVSDGTRTWTYGYTSYTYGKSLSSVTLPDTSQWLFSLATMAQYTPNTARADVQTCTNMPPLNSGTATGTITHPSGAVGTFTVKSVRHARSYVVKYCVQDGEWTGGLVPGHAEYPIVFDSPSIQSKQISGPGMTTATWNYTYTPGSGSWAEDCAGGCTATKTVEVRGPDDTWQRYTFGTRFRTDEGRIYRQETGTDNGSGPVLYRDETFTFQDSSGQPFPAAVGDLVHERGDGMAARLDPQKTHVTTQQGVTFTSTTNTFNVFAAPLSVTRSSSGSAGGNNSRTETMTYAHDTAKWVIGQPATTTDVATGKVASETTYNAAMLPWKVYRFGHLKNTLTYNADGTLATVKDGRDNTISLSNWYRGVPRRIDYPTSVFETATVNGLGQVTGTTDELTYSHAYGYDTMGRLNAITYPTADTTTWNALSRGFVAVTASEYGIASGHWKQTVQTGNGKTTTYYDALWRPVLVLTEDTANAASKSFVVTRYDVDGRVSFQSYPVDSLTTVNDTLSGVTTTYDPLGRVYQVKQDSELGVLTTTSEYLSGFVTRVTNPRGYISETKYQLFDSPATDAPVEIVTAKGQTEQQTTAIERDGFGKPVSVTRSGAAP